MNNPQLVKHNKSLAEIYQLDMPDTVGQVVPNINNVRKLIEGMKEWIHYDDFYQNIMKDDGTPWEKHDTLQLTMFLQERGNMQRVTSSIVQEGVEAYASMHRRNAPRDWINSLPEWDRKPRVEQFFVDCADAEDNVYTRAVGANFFVALVARIMKPGCQVDEMIVLEGPQGSKKSSLLEVIGGKWHGAPTCSVEQKDWYICMRGKLIIEFADLSSFYKTEINKIKHMITLRTDTYRGLWDKTASDHPRQCIFAGTTNDSVYLNDDTGARRFLPILTRKINLEKAKNERDQLFAEALFLYNFSHTWHELPPQAIEEQESRRTSDPWEYDIKKYLKNKEQVEIEQVIDECIRKEKKDRTRQDSIRVGKILKMLKWERKQVRRGEDRFYAYTPPPLAIEEIPSEVHPIWQD